MGFDIRLAAFADDLRDDAFAEFSFGGVLDDFDDDLVAELGVLGFGVADDNGFVHELAIDLDEEGPIFLHEYADVLLVSALNDFDDLSGVGRTTRACTGASAIVSHIGADAVAGHGVHGATFGDEEVAMFGG